MPAGVAHCGPRNAIKRFANALFDDRGVASRWVASARAAAILGPCRRSLLQVRSGLRCWATFADKVLGLDLTVWPPPLDGILAWSALFRCRRTFANYIGYLRVCCALTDTDPSVFSHIAVRRARVAIEKRGLFDQREKLFFRHDTLAQLIAVTPSDERMLHAQMCFLTAYIFLLRVPSECLPFIVGGGDFLRGVQSSLCIRSNCIGLRLRTRKNKRHGSVLWRQCWCSQQASTCSVKVFGRWAATKPVGTALFCGLNAGMATKLLRCILAALKVEGAERYRLQDFRRGHADDLANSGASLLEILKAGEWRSPAFLKYLNIESLERHSVVQAHVDESSEDEFREPVEAQRPPPSRGEARSHS